MGKSCCATKLLPAVSGKDLSCKCLPVQKSSSFQCILTWIEDQVCSNGPYAALSEHRIKGAGLDVFDTEPLPEESKLWKLDNVLISPHCVDRTRTYLTEAIQQFVENAKLYVEGKKLNNICDKQAGY